MPAPNTAVAFDLLRVATSSAASTRDEPREPLALDVTDWSAVLWLGRRHGVLLHLLAMLERSPLVRVPADIMDSLRQHRYNEALARLARFREMLAIQKALSADGISAIAIGSWALSQAHYQVPELRAIGHHDRLLVKPADRTRAEACLRPLGYAFGPIDPLELQPHTRPRLRLTENDRVWERCDSLDSGPLHFLVPSAVDWLLFITARFGRPNRANTLEHAFDVVSLLRSGADIGWDVLRATATGRREQLRAVAGTAASYDLLGHPRPGPIEALCHGSARVRRAVRHLVDSCADRPITEHPARARPVVPIRPDEYGSLGRFAATPRIVADRMLALAGVELGDVVYDLGCGDGRIVVRAAQLYGARGVGIDRDPQRIHEAEELARAEGVGHLVTFRQHELLDTALEDASVVCLYLQGFAYARLEHWLRRQLRSGTRIVSHHLAFPDWVPTKTAIVSSEGARGSFVYVWVVP